MEGLNYSSSMRQRLGFGDRGVRNYASSVHKGIPVRDDSQRLTDNIKSCIIRNVVSRCCFSFLTVEIVQGLPLYHCSQRFSQVHVPCFNSVERGASVHSSVTREQKKKIVDVATKHIKFRFRFRKESTFSTSKEIYVCVCVCVCVCVYQMCVCVSVSYMYTQTW